MKLKLIAVALLCLAGCEGARESDMSVVSAELTTMDEKSPSINDEPERRLIKEGSVEFETLNWKKTKKQLSAICDSLGAYSADESLSNQSDRISYHQLLRVPSRQFNDLVAEIEKLSNGLENISIKVDDVTKAYIDVEVRIKNKKEMESRYRQLLTHAKDVEEMLKVERYITDVRTDIERMEATLKNMQDRIALSSLDVTFYEVIVTDYGFRTRLLAALSNGWQSILVVIVGLASIWPFVVLTPLVVWWLRRSVFAVKGGG